MLPSTLHIPASNEYLSDEPEEPCPLCSDKLLKQSALLSELERIEQRFLGRIQSSAIVRIQYAHYCSSYRKPLEDNGREFVDVTKDDITVHFDKHRICESRLILADVAAAREAQRNVMGDASEGISENKMKTWMQLSKHKHELVRTLGNIRGAQTNSATGESTTQARARLHNV